MNLVKFSIKNITDKPYQAVLTLIMLIMGVALASLLVLVGGALDDSFKKNIKGIDMVVGAKGSPLQLILSAVYQIDSQTGNISLAEADQLAKNRLVDKTIQLSYGDSYKGRRIIGTSSDYLELYEAQFEEGTIFKESFEAVLGALVAEENDLKIGDEFFSAHGDDETAEIHGDLPFRVTGVLKRLQKRMNFLPLRDASTSMLPELKALLFARKPTTEPPIRPNAVINCFPRSG